MTVQTTTDTSAILDRIGPVLRADPVRNTVFASIDKYLRSAGDGGWCAHDGAALAARCSPDHPIALTEGWTDLRALADAVAALPSVCALGGPVAPVDELVALLGRAPRRRLVESLYRLDELTEPAGVPGRARLADRGDLELATRWASASTLEIFGGLPPNFDPKRLAAAMIDASQEWLWLDPDDQPVSMAARRQPSAGVARIRPVYTPPEHRGHGYGSAVTARAVAEVLADGAVAVLYADVDNPTSNKIYRAIGFRPVTDRVDITF